MASPPPSPVPPSPEPEGVVPGPSVALAAVALHGRPDSRSGVVRTIGADGRLYVLEGALSNPAGTWRLVQYSGDAAHGWRAAGWTGWVEEAALEARVRAMHPSCPQAPTAAELASLTPGERLTCYGSGVLILSPAMSIFYKIGGDTNRWLTDDGRPDFATSIPYYLADGAYPVHIATNHWLIVLGRFNAPASACKPTTAVGEPDPAYLQCRERFVVSGSRKAEPPAFEARGRWRVIADSPLTGRYQAYSTWTGTEMLVWGGTQRTDGAAYDPRANDWRTLPRAPIGDRSNAATAWTEGLWLIWGGRGPRGRRDLADGASYDPARNRWTTLPAAPIEGGAAQAAWTGTEMIVVTATGQAAAYDPAVSAWRRLPDLGQAPGQMELVWTGAELLVFEWGDALNTPVYLIKYVPATNTWSARISTPISALYADPGAGVWIGNKVVFVSFLSDRLTGQGYLGNASYDPSDDQWTELHVPCDIRGPMWAAGSRMISQEALYDPASNTCLRLPRPPNRPGFRDPAREAAAAVVWTGSQFILWSGGTGGDLIGPPPADGVAFSPRPENP
jgi:hypothetical protein